MNEVRQPRRAVDPARRRANVRLAVVIALVALAFYLGMFFLNPR